MSGIAGRPVPAIRQANLDKSRRMHAGRVIDAHLMQRKADAMNALIARRLSTIKQISR